MSPSTNKLPSAAEVINRIRCLHGRHVSIQIAVTKLFWDLVPKLAATSDKQPIDVDAAIKRVQIQHKSWEDAIQVMSTELLTHYGVMASPRDAPSTAKRPRVPSDHSLIPEKSTRQAPATIFDLRSSSPVQNKPEILK